MSATLVLDSISPAGARLTTFELTMSVHCLGQITKHRALSQNAESARAVPIALTVAQVEADPWEPRTMLRNGKGMQPPGPIEAAMEPGARAAWRQAARAAVKYAKTLEEFGVHKEITNRLLAPFRRVKVVVSGTSWDDFFPVRCAPAAQEEIRDLAHAMLGMMAGSVPVERKVHAPYVDELDLCERYEVDPRGFLLVSAYRCARVSYGRPGGSELTLEEETRRGRKLADDLHWSALEHAATAAPWCERSGNFTGWRQLRKDMGG